MVLLENIFFRIDEHELLLLLLKLFLLMLVGSLLLIAVSLTFMELFFLSANSFFQSLDLALLFSDGLFVVFVLFLMSFLILLLFFDNFLLFFDIFSYFPKRFHSFLLIISFFLTSYLLTNEPYVAFLQYYSLLFSSDH